MKLAILVLVAACNAELDQRLAIVREPRVLAILSEPAEAKPGAQVTYSALIASPSGPVTSAPDWALCTAPKPPTEDNAVSTACLSSDSLVELGATAMPAATLPSDACIQFGPDVPPGGFRPRDADATGGYYQPVRAQADGADLAFGFSRITCNLPNAPGDVAHDYQTMYVANQNPTLIVAVDPIVTAASDVTITASWPSDAAESYLYYDPQSETLVTRREAMRASWFATAGSLPVDATAVGEDDPTAAVSTTWHTPSAGPAWLWIVLRDSRGGIAVATIAITVQ